jgi:hypothetical protein
MNLYVARINHQPLEIGFIYQCFQQAFPSSFVPPSTKSTVRIFPITVIRWQIPPWGTATQYPEHCVDELTIVAGIASPSAFATKQVRFQKFPDSIG